MRDIEKDMIVLNYLFDGDIKLGRSINSPLGGDDNPSFSFYKSKGDNPRIRYKLFNSGENGSLIDFISAYKQVNIGLAFKTYNEIINQEGDSELQIDKIKQQLKQSPPPKLILNNHFSYIELLYWMDFGITEKQLLFNNIYSVVSLSYYGVIAGRSTLDTPVFAYLYPEFRNEKGVPFKSYNPLAEERRDKWKSFNISDIVCGYGQLPDTADFISLISSKKDGMCYRNWMVDNHGMKYEDIAVGAPPAEGSFQPILRREEEFIDRFNFMNIIQDTDDAGKALAQKLYNSLKYKEKARIVDVNYGINSKDFGEGTHNNNKIILNI